MAGILDGKAALVTGGARGIGRAAALVFAREGARIVVTDLNGEGAQETVSLINKAGGQAVSATGDVTDPAVVKRWVDLTVSSFGKIDCAFNNAGIAPYQVSAGGMRTADWSEESFDRMIAVNLKSVWMCMKAEIGAMLKSGGGAIVNTASVAGLVGLEMSSAYVAAKHGVVGLTKTAGLEYATDGIRVNAVCPGFIATDMTKDSMARRGDVLIGRIAQGRMGTADEIAETVAWLCSERASYVNGASFNVDGGYYAR